MRCYALWSKAEDREFSERKFGGVARAREILIKQVIITYNMKSYISSKVKLGKSKIGKGLFVLKKIRKGELIIDFAKGPGKFLTTKEADKLYEKGNDYMIQVNDDLFFVATNKEELEDADFLNHSCNSNCGINGTLKIVAMRDIEPGEELTFDYAMCESSEYRMKCNCGSSDCRKIIIGDDWKIKELQKRYKRFFSDYLKKRMAHEGN
jgi:hypothetical protein